MDSEKHFVTIFLSAVALVVIFCIAWLYPYSESTMTIRTMQWHRAILEKDDYQEYVCHTRTRTKSDGKTTETYRDCGYETKTRVVNRWNTAGEYPQEPFWASDYTIGPGHYEGREETYTIVFSDDIDLYRYNCYFNQYQAMKPREKHKVQLNIFSSIVGIIE